MLIGKGRDRACYVHPENPSLCIKVAIKKEKQSKREKRYLSYLKRKGRELSCFSQYLGSVGTNLGKGYVFELARDSEGNIAFTLKKAMEQRLLNRKEIMSLILEIEKNIIEQNICVYDLTPNNVAVFRGQDNEIHYIIIDGLGVSNLNPLSTRLSFLIRRSQKHSLTKFKKKIHSLLDAYVLR